MTPRTTPVDLNAIEAEARRLRAQAFRDGLTALRGWLAGLLAGKGQGARA